MKVLIAAFSIIAVSHAYQLVDESKEPLMSEQLAYEINTSGGSWNATHISPKFQAWSICHAKQFMACGRTDGLEKLPSISHDAETIAATPSSFDPRVSRKGCTGPVSEEPVRSSCYAAWMCYLVCITAPPL